MSAVQIHVLAKEDAVVHSLLFDEIYELWNGTLGIQKYDTIDIKIR